jgi:hypothetical protein
MGAAIVRHEEAKKHLKSTEAALEAAWDRLYRAERNEPDPQQGTLFEAPAETATGSNGQADTDLEERQKAWDAKWEAFIAQSIDVLELSDFMREKLAGEDIATLKDLAAFKAASQGQGYTLIDGIGTEKADKIDDAYVRVMEAFLAQHPNPSQSTPAAKRLAADEGVPQADPGSYDFVDTFPPPVNPTPNETYDADYHRQAIKDATDELTELRHCKDCLSRNVNEAGKPLTSSSKKTIETKIGELQMQYDEGYTMYAEKFGKIAGDALRRHVEGAVEKKASLRGGLE